MKRFLSMSIFVIKVKYFKKNQTNRHKMLQHPYLKEMNSLINE